MVAAAGDRYQDVDWREHYDDEDVDTLSQCSTCSSSSSSDSDDPYADQLPPRRAYGGVRISYVPNDRFASRAASHLNGGRSSLRVTSSAARESPGGMGGGGVAPVNMMNGQPYHVGQSNGGHRVRSVSTEKEKDKICVIS